VGKGEIRVGKIILLVTLPTLASEYLQTHQLASSQSCSLKISVNIIEDNFIFAMDMNEI